MSRFEVALLLAALSTGLASCSQHQPRTAVIRERITLALTVDRVALTIGDRLRVEGVRRCEHGDGGPVLVPLRSSDGSVLRLLSPDDERGGGSVQEFEAVGAGLASLNPPGGCGLVCAGDMGAHFLATISVTVARQ